MAAKTESQLALADKTDLARTLVRFKHRRQAARELNQIETLLIETHEDDNGNYTATNPDELINAMVGAMTGKALPSGEK